MNAKLFSSVLLFIFLFKLGFGQKIYYFEKDFHPVKKRRHAKYHRKYKRLEKDTFIYRTYIKGTDTLVEQGYVFKFKKRVAVGKTVKGYRKFGKHVRLTDNGDTIFVQNYNLSGKRHGIWKYFKKDHFVFCKYDNGIIILGEDFDKELQKKKDQKEYLLNDSLMTLYDSILTTFIKVKECRKCVHPDSISKCNNKNLSINYYRYFSFLALNDYGAIFVIKISATGKVLDYRLIKGKNAEANSAIIDFITNLPDFIPPKFKEGIKPRDILFYVKISDSFPGVTF